MSSCSLYSVQAILILDNQGNRVYAEYYSPPSEGNTDEASSSLLNSTTKQLEFEKKLFKKTFKRNSDIMLFENHLVLFKEYIDVTIYLIGDSSENELVLQSALDALGDSLEIVLSNGIDKKSVEENFDLVLLDIDEVVDNGIILETDAATIASRITKRPANENAIAIDLDKGLLSAWGFAKSKLQEKLQQGLQ